MIALALVGLLQISAAESATERTPVRVAFVSDLPGEGHASAAIVRDPVDGDAILLRNGARAEDFEAAVKAYIALRRRADANVDGVVTLQPALTVDPQQPAGADRRELTARARTRIEQLFARIRDAEARPLRGFGSVRQTTIHVRIVARR